MTARVAVAENDDKFAAIVSLTQFNLSLQNWPKVVDSRAQLSSQWYTSGLLCRRWFATRQVAYGKLVIVLCNCYTCSHQDIQWSIIQRLQSCECGGRSTITYEDASQVIATWCPPDFTPEVVRGHIRCYDCLISQPVISWQSVLSMFQDCKGPAILKKAVADWADPANYRQISDLSTISKVLERLALAQLQPHLLTSNNFCQFHSGFHTNHSTEKVHIKLLNDIYTTGVDRRFTVVISLDISAAFTISHTVLLSPNRVRTDLHYTSLCVLLSVQPATVCEHGRHSPSLLDCCSGIPQGSVLGPLLFAAYVSPVRSVVESFGVRYQ